MMSVVPFPLTLLLFLVGFSPLLGACSTEPQDLSETMITHAQGITAIITSHLDLRNGSPKNCNEVAGKLHGWLETNKANLFGLDDRRKKLSAAARKQLNDRLAQHMFGSIISRLKHTHEQFKKQCPAQAEAVEYALDRVHCGQMLR